MTYKFWILIFCTTFVFGCKSKKEVKVEETIKQPIESVEIESPISEYVGNYQVVMVGDFQEMNEVFPTLNIQKDGKVSGNNGCNSYFGKFNLEEGQKFVNIGSTRMACDGEGGDVERAMNAAFETGNLIERDDNGIVLMGDNLVVLKANRLTLQKGEWRLISLGTTRIKEPIVFFSITEGNLAGTTGCNSFTGTLSEEGYSIKFMDVSATEMDCEEFDTVSEVVFLRALEKVTRYQLKGNLATFFVGNQEAFILENMQQF